MAETLVREPQERATRESHKREPQERATRESHKRELRERTTREDYERGLREFHEIIIHIISIIKVWRSAIIKSSLMVTDSDMTDTTDTGPQTRNALIGARFPVAICRYSWKFLWTLLLASIFCSSAQAHLMVAQHGTLNFLDESVYLVLSLPASAFTAADEDEDQLLSISEFSKHRLDIINSVAEHVILSDEDNQFALSNIMVSPVTPHDAPKDPADQIVVMGRFSISENARNYYFQVGLFGQESDSQLLEITATRKSTNSKHAFELLPDTGLMKLKLH